MKVLRLTNDYDHGAEFFWARPHASWNVGEGICRHGLQSYVNGVSDTTPFIEIVARKQADVGGDDFEITARGTVIGVRRALDCDFEEWLRKAYDEGYRFVTVYTP